MQQDKLNSKKEALKKRRNVGEKPLYPIDIEIIHE